MIGWIKKYWAEVVVVVIVFGVLLMNAAVDKTWINTNSDGIHLTFAAKFLYAAHKTSAPLFLLLGHLVLKLPWGTEFWRMTLISVVGTTIGSIFVYKIIREHLRVRFADRDFIFADPPHAKWYALLGVILFAGSALVMSQSIIVKYYSMTAMFGLIAYYLLLRRRYSWSVVALGAGIATHGIILFTMIPLFIFNKPLWRWKHLFILAGFSLFYLYAPLVGKFNPPPVNMWGNLTASSQIADVYSTMMMLSGGLAIYDVPKRILDTLGVLGVSLGLALIPIVIYFIKDKKFWKNQLFWLFAMPILYFMSNFSPQTYVYLFPTVGYGAVIACIQLSKVKRYLLYSTAVVAIALFAFNSNYFDIGRTEDPHLSATEYYNVELAKVPDGQILMPEYGWQWTAIIVYNQENGRHIIPVCLDSIVSPNYLETVKSYGVKFKDVGTVNVANMMDKRNTLAASIVQMNPNVWTTVRTTPETYGAKVMPTNGDPSTVVRVSPEPAGRIHWKPSSPYGIVSGSIEETEWNYLTLSNWNVMFFTGLASIGLILNWLIFILPSKRNPVVYGGEQKHVGKVVSE